ncbi:MAG: DUF3473 domain-containing protein [Phycisphaerae bacterium]|nr:DUF3473 domain-containing protein [Phycisphaerae bacterium]
MEKQAIGNHVNIKHVLSFDVEEYFQVEAAREGGMTPEKWSQYPSRVDLQVNRVLGILDDFQTKATFFVLGSVASKHRDLIKRIADGGHEIASHGMTHKMLTRLTPEEFAAELRESREILSDITGVDVQGFRAPTFSITHKNPWAIDVLTDSGFTYDSSVFPVVHKRYGVPDVSRWTHVAAGPSGGKIVELPPVTLRVLRRNIPIGGGGYLRLFPVKFVAAGLKAAQRHAAAGMIYMHPWEFDPAQPVTPMSRRNRFRHRVNLSRTEPKLRYLLKRFDFQTAERYVKSILPENLETFAY